MPDAETLALMAAVALAMGLTPGPDMLFCFAMGVEKGPRGAVAASAGIGLGLVVHVALAILGVAGLVAASPAAFEAIRWAGAGYLLWLACKAFTAPPTLLEAPDGAAPRGELSAVFWKGTLTCLTNPKLLLFFLAFLPQFVKPDAGNVPLQMLVLSLIFITPGSLINTAVGVSGGGLGRLMRRHPGWVKAQNRIVGGVFAALALRLALAGRG